MNAKEAKEIVNHPEEYCDNPFLHKKIDNAKAGLEALQWDEVKELVEALKTIMVTLPFGEGSVKPYEMAKEAIKKYEESIK